MGSSRKPCAPGASGEYLPSPSCGRKVSRAWLSHRLPDQHEAGRAMEFLNFVLITWTAWLVWRRPEREGRAFGLLLVSCLLMALLFLVGTHTSFVPGINL
jgi:heme A synthase